jgi:hypothetical protein
LIDFARVNAGFRSEDLDEFPLGDIRTRTGIRLRTSPLIPRYDERVLELRRENLQILLGGGSLVDCERPGSPVVAFLIESDLYVHPDNFVILKNALF